MSSNIRFNQRERMSRHKMLNISIKVEEREKQGFLKKSTKQWKCPRINLIKRDMPVQINVKHIHNI